MIYSTQIRLVLSIRNPYNGRQIKITIWTMTSERNFGKIVRTVCLTFQLWNEHSIKLTFVRVYIYSRHIWDLPNGNDLWMDTIKNGVTFILQIKQNERETESSTVERNVTVLFANLLTRYHYNSYEWEMSYIKIRHGIWPDVRHYKLIFNTEIEHFNFPLPSYLFIYF